MDSFWDPPRIEIEWNSVRCVACCCGRYGLRGWLGRGLGVGNGTTVGMELDAICVRVCVRRRPKRNKQLKNTRNCNGKLPWFMPHMSCYCCCCCCYCHCCGTCAVASTMDKWNDTRWNRFSENSCMLRWNCFASCLPRILCISLGNITDRVLRTI